ncbi:hypothetical protein AAY473_037523 [Plecturocebus cupreus]
MALQDIKEALKPRAFSRASVLRDALDVLMPQPSEAPSPVPRATALQCAVQAWGGLPGPRSVPATPFLLHLREQGASPSPSSTLSPPQTQPPRNR